MRTQWKPNRLAFVAIISIGVAIAVNLWAVDRQPLPSTTTMHEAAALCARWFDAVADLKRERGIVSDSRSVARYAALIGDGYTYLTTTLGSLEAKETAANPDFAALVTRWYREAGVDSSSTVGILLSGSFPSLAIATLAATQTIGAKAVVVSSLGASTYGANQPEATWADMELWLKDHAGLRYASALVTLGAEDDNGSGLTEEGVALLRQAAARCGVALYEPATLEETIAAKTRLLTAANIDLLVNIGGNQAALGRCPQSSAVPNGLHFDWPHSAHPQRGVLARLEELGVPFIHLLNIKDLAGRYGLPISPGPELAAATDLYDTRHVNALGPVLGCSIILALLCCFRTWRQRSRRPLSARSGRDELDRNHKIMDATRKYTSRHR